MAEFPRDWQIDTIGNLVEIETGSKNTQDKEDGGDYPFYVRSDTVERINCYTHDTDGVVTAGDGVGTGKIFHYVKGRFALHQRCYLMHQFKPVLDPQYFYWFFKTYFYDRITAMTAKSSVDSVRREMIAGMQIAYPENIGEQRRIADALGSVDKLIDNLTRRIEKKRLVKQGVMQELLTGKKRLPGFKGEWNAFRLFNVAEFSSTTIPSSRVDLNWYIGTENMLPNCGGVERNTAAVPYVNVREFVAGDILVSNIRPYLKKIWLADKNGGCSTDVLVVRGNRTLITPTFLYCIMSSDRFFNYVMDNAIGTKMPRGDKRVIMLYEISIPTLREQESIASILGNMDAEIAKLEAKRDKYIDIKQGMMNDLLTGKVRI